MRILESQPPRHSAASSASLSIRQPFIRVPASILFSRSPATLPLSPCLPPLPSFSLPFKRALEPAHTESASTMGPTGVSLSTCGTSTSGAGVKGPSSAQPSPAQPASRQPRSGRRYQLNQLDECIEATQGDPAIGEDALRLKASQPGSPSWPGGHPAGPNRPPARTLPALYNGFSLYGISLYNVFSLIAYFPLKRNSLDNGFLFMINFPDHAGHWLPGVARGSP